MSAGLDTSTVTPGSDAPDVSRAEPAIDAWAIASAGSRMNSAASVALEKEICMVPRSYTSGTRLHLLRDVYVRVNPFLPFVTVNWPFRCTDALIQCPLQSAVSSTLAIMSLDAL